MQRLFVEKCQVDFFLYKFDGVLPESLKMYTEDGTIGHLWWKRRQSLKMNHGIFLYKTSISKTSFSELFSSQRRVQDGSWDIMMYVSFMNWRCSFATFFSMSIHGSSWHVGICQLEDTFVFFRKHSQIMSWEDCSWSFCHFQVSDLWLLHAFSCSQVVH